MDGIPLIYENKCLIRRKFYQNSEISTFCVTKKLELIEINRNQEIVNYIKLQNSDEIFDFFVANKIQLKIYECLDSTLMLLFQLNDKVYAIKHKKSGLKLIKGCHRVDSFKIKGQTKKNENVFILKMKDGSKMMMKNGDMIDKGGMMMDSTGKMMPMDKKM